MRIEWLVASAALMLAIAGTAEAQTRRLTVFGMVDDSYDQAGLFGPTIHKGDQLTYTANVVGGPANGDIPGSNPDVAVSQISFSVGGHQIPHYGKYGFGGRGSYSFDHFGPDAFLSFADVAYDCCRFDVDAEYTFSLAFLGPLQANGDIAASNSGGGSYYYQTLIPSNGVRADQGIIAFTLVSGSLVSLPESETWVTMSLGFGVLGFGLRRRRIGKDMRVA